MASLRFCTNEARKLKRDSTTSQSATRCKNLKYLCLEAIKNELNITDNLMHCDAANPRNVTNGRAMFIAEKL